MRHQQSQQLSAGGASSASLWLSETHHPHGSALFIVDRLVFHLNEDASAGRRWEVLSANSHRILLLLTVGVWASVELQVLHVFAVQLHVELLQWVFPLPQRWFQPQDPLHVFLHQAGLKPHDNPTINNKLTAGGRFFFSFFRKAVSNMVHFKPVKWPSVNT